jgi:hypothetical protein
MRTVLVLALLLSVGSPRAFAADAAPTTPPEKHDAADASGSADNDEAPMRHHMPRISVAVGPAWVHVLRDNYSGAFSPNGFNTPSKDRIGFDFMAYFNTESHWQLGLGMDSFSFEQNNGTNAAGYSNNLFGIYVARVFTHNETCDLTVGTLLGGEHSELTVFSGTRNGRLRENSAVVAPTIGVAERINRYFKLGLKVSYAVPFGESTELAGNDLAVSKIGVRGLIVAGQIILGRY